MTSAAGVGRRRLAALSLAFEDGASVPWQMIFSFGVQAGGAVAAYAAQVFIARSLGPSNYGTIAWLIAAGTLGASLASMGMPSAAIRFVPQYVAQGRQDKVRAFLRRGRLLSAVSGLFVGGIGATAAAIASVSHQPSVSIACALIPAIALMNFNAEAVRSLRRVVAAYAPPLLIRPILWLLISVAVFHVAGSSANAALSALLAATIAVVVVQAVAVRVVPGSPSHALTRPEMMEWLRVGIALLGSSTALLLISQTDVIVLGAVRGSYSAGIYAAAARTALILALVGIAVNSVAAPRFAPAASAGGQYLAKIAASAAAWAFIPSALIAGAFLAETRPVLSVFGNQFMHGAWSLRILVVGQLVNVATGSVGYLLGTTGHQRRAMLVYVVAATTNLASCVPLAYAFGATGAALATAITLGAANLLLYWDVRRLLRIDPSVIAAFRFGRDS